MSKVAVLSSGGIDSTTALSLAIKEHGKENVMTVTVMYGQKHCVEAAHAKQIADYYGIRNECLDLHQIFEKSNCALLQQSTEKVPEGSYDEQIGKTDSGIVATYVPGRNALMLCAVASLAQSIFGIEEEIEIYLGNHADDAAGNAYPDCSEEFSEAIARAIHVGSGNKVTVRTPFVSMNKSQVVAEGLKMHTPYWLTYSCYNGGLKSCGIYCATCIDRINAFRANKVIDPIDYLADVDWTGCHSIEYIEDSYHD